MNKKRIEKLVWNEIQDVVVVGNIVVNSAELSRRIADVIHEEIRGNAQFVIDILKDQLK